MARIRSIKPDFFTDERLGECSTSARLALVACLVFADDEGNLERSARQLKAQAFPYDSLNVEPLIVELLDHGLVIEYEVGGKKLLHIKGFKKHQKIDRPSSPKFPLYEPSMRTQRTLDEPSMLKGREGKGEEGITTTTTTSSEPKNDAVLHIPLVGKAEYAVSAELVGELSKLYPAVDVPQTLNEIRGWNLANPTKRKTARGILNHINRWMEKEQNRGPKT